ncbi:hypothetical protein Lesp01_74240 [Lentzea sp. NBRC 102530]|nr:hypothetical protein Lesp01_74240 [Lentzea sp. NBRC 102530]
MSPLTEGPRTIPYDLARPNRACQGGTYRLDVIMRWDGPLDTCGCPRGGHTGWCVPRPPLEHDVPALPRTILETCPSGEDML